MNLVLKFFFGLADLLGAQKMCIRDSYCAAYTLTLCLISFKIASAHNMTFCKAMYLLPCLWICVDFLFYCLKETLAADVREGRIMDEEKT